MQQQEYPPKGFEKDKDVFVGASKNLSFRIENYLRDSEKNETTTQQTWLISKKDKNRHVQLPIPTLKLEEGATSIFDRFWISPDESTLLMTRHVASQTNEMLALQRVSELKYRLFPTSLNEIVGKGDAEDCWFLTLKEWRQGGRIAVLESIVDHGIIVKWVGSFDIVTKRLIPINLPPKSVAPSSHPMKGERYPETRLVHLSQKDVERWNYEKVRYALNEMYARYGFVFSDKEILLVFRDMEWYVGRLYLKMAQIEAAMSPTERANLAVLGRRREAIKAR